MKLKSNLPACGLLAAALLSGAGSSVWESNSYNDFVRGQFNGVALTRDGRLTLAPKLDPLAAADNAVFSLAAAPDGAWYYGSGYPARVWRLRPGGTPEALAALPKPAVFAVAPAPGGAVYAATSPDGAVYRVTLNRAEELCRPGQKYIWALAAARDGTLYAGTGDGGQVWRIPPGGKCEVYYETGQTHVTALAFDAQGRLLAGTEPNGILYRIEGPKRAFALFDSSLPEIRSILPAPDGSIYIGALGGGLAQKQATAAAGAASQPGQMPVVTTTITVTADAATQAGIDLKPKPEQAKPAEAPAPPPAPPVVDVAGVERSAIYRLAADNTAETLWSSKEENLFDLALRGEDLYFSTDQRGRLYRLSRDLKAALLYELRDGDLTRLAASQKGIVAAAATPGRLLELAETLNASGVYESPVHDAGNAARWGRLTWRADPRGGRVVFRTRSGNSLRPDATWSEWSEPLSDPARNLITSPNARYIQWQAELSGPPANPPLLDAVSVTYLQQNSRPVVRSITVTQQWTPAPAKPGPAAGVTSTTAYSITVTDTGEAAPATSPGTPTQTVNRSGNPQIVLTWQADDNDNDKLVYAVHYRGEDETAWKLLKEELTDNALYQDADFFADGRYLFRVTASDRLSNPPSAARENELLSSPVLIDHTPPRVTLALVRRGAAGVEINVEAEDAASPLRRAEYSLDGAAWKLLECADGIVDSPRESFPLRLSGLAAGEHAVVVRVYDSAGNPGLGKLVLR
jgi:outer membrane protein assembly factor BamB